MFSNESSILIQSFDLKDNKDNLDDNDTDDLMIYNDEENSDLLKQIDFIQVKKVR